MEFRDLYNSKKILTGEVIEKGQTVPADRYYITVAVFIENTKGQFLVQQRILRKDGRWATTGGHPKSGESSLQGIITEIQEEIGQKVKENELALFKTIMTEDDFVDLYYMKKDINIEDIIIQEEEVADVMWASRDEIEELIQSDRFSKSHAEFYRYCLDFLDS